MDDWDPGWAFQLPGAEPVRTDPDKVHPSAKAGAQLRGAAAVLRRTPDGWRPVAVYSESQPCDWAA